jgi:[acyl-carrier-protein] S-malonyltransferase
MAANLCNEVPQAKVLFDKASAILGYDLLDKCVNGPKETLDSTVVAQTAIFVTSMACVEKLRQESPEAADSATVAMGLSLGEYSALCFAGAFSFEDGVKLTKARGEAMQEAANADKSGMVAVIGLDAATVEKMCVEAAARSGKPVSIANYVRT